MGKHLGPQYHVFNDITRPAISDSDLSSSELRHLFYCSGNPLEPYLPNLFPKGISGQEKKLGYGKNDKDWAIRRVST